MSEPGTALRALLVCLAVALLPGALLPAARGADDPAGLHQQASELRRTNEALAGEAGATVAALASLDAQLAGARAELARFRRQAARIARLVSEARLRLDVARKAMVVSQRGLATRLRALYEQGQPEPLAVILGSASLDEAVTGIEHLGRLADEDRLYVMRARAARRELVEVTEELASREAENERLRAAATDAVATIIRGRAARLARLAAIRSTQSANAMRISSLESQARSLALRAAASATAAPVLEPVPVAGARILTVVATGYSLPGHTAGGVPVAPGVVAVDPSVIPLGSRLTIPGYGEGIAADTGGAIQGARIDLWFASVAEAKAWGRRTVTVTVHG